MQNNVQVLTRFLVKMVTEESTNVKFAAKQFVLNKIPKLNSKYSFMKGDTLNR